MSIHPLSQLLVASLVFVAPGCIHADNRRCSPVPTVSSRELDMSVLDDDRGPSAHNLFGYDFVVFGPVGRRIISERRPEDMALLKACLEYTDGPRIVVVVENQLPSRRCDYALMIAEMILGGGDENTGVQHSFAPFTSYEYRDAARRDAVKRLFGRDTLSEPVEYVYRDALGNDISEERRRNTVGMP